MVPERLLRRADVIAVGDVARVSSAGLGVRSVRVKMGLASLERAESLRAGIIDAVEEWVVGMNGLAVLLERALSGMGDSAARVQSDRVMIGLWVFLELFLVWRLVLTAGRVTADRCKGLNPGRSAKTPQRGQDKVRTYDTRLSVHLTGENTVHTERDQLVREAVRREANYRGRLLDAGASSFRRCVPSGKGVEGKRIDMRLQGVRRSGLTGVRDVRALRARVGRAGPLGADIGRDMVVHESGENGGFVGILASIR